MMMLGDLDGDTASIVHVCKTHLRFVLDSGLFHPEADWTAAGPSFELFWNKKNKLTFDTIFKCCFVGVNIATMMAYQWWEKILQSSAFHPRS